LHVEAPHASSLISNHIRIVLYDQLGRAITMLHEGEAHDGSAYISLPLSGIPNGLYTLVITTSNMSTTRSLVIQR
jgi:hypothetical protein